MNRLLLVRHAEATSPCRDADLTAVGRKQAEAVAHRLREWSFDAAWSSDLRRARETADTIMQGRDAPQLQLAAALREVDVPLESCETGLESYRYAAWEKKTVDELARNLSIWLKDMEQARCKQRYCTTLVVSHAGPLRVLMCLLLGLPPKMHWSFRLDHASISVVERGDDMGTIALLNDRCHLG